MVLVLSLLAVLVALAAPRFADATARYRVESAARRIAADLALARSEARVGNSRRSVLFAGAGYRMPGVPHPDRRPGDYTVDLAAEPYRLDALSAELGGDAEIVFDPFGAPDSGGQVLVRVGRWTRIVTIEAQTARVVVQ